MKNCTLHTMTMFLQYYCKKNHALWFCVYWGRDFWSSVITQITLKLLSTLHSWRLSIFMKPGATSSQAGQVTHLTEFPWRFLPSMLSELMHYKHLVLSAKVITFEKNSLLAFVLHAYIHSKRIFLSACVITWVTFQRRFLQLCVISI